ncbi:hypothetical protein DL89DRAFT_324022 [Linderina pennispora]|uniref:Uncharacterized protein n=1 Tax=Linderina pennispora TaxID=61395 RepID=A0A1Y1W2Q9_9FUNG|nr:uncharacterized protein DL89DRAFT_324022 [Linderina pennispora]ORX67840.1 hypothetical protein DL89DRAFT_324022 [Linderina pennispora]
MPTDDETQPLHGSQSSPDSLAHELSWLGKASLPLIGSYYLHYLFGFLNLISLGAWGGQALGGYALANMTCANPGVRPGHRHSIGAGHAVHRVGLHLQRGLTAVTLWYVVVLCIMQFAMPTVYDVLGQPRELAEPAAEYLKVLSLGLWPWMAFECLKRYVQANTQMRLPALVLAAVVPVHLLNHYVFVWRRHASFTAVAWITVFSYWAMFLGLVFCTLAWDALRPAWHRHRPKELISTSFYALAVPAMVEACGEYMAFELMTLLAAQLGKTSLAAQAIAFNSMSMVYQLPHGVGGAAAVRIGRLLGRGQTSRACFSAADPEVLAVARRLIRIVAMIEWTDATRAIVPGILRGMGKQRWAATINIGAYYCLVLPLGAMAWAAFALGMSVLAAAYIVAILRTDWSRERTDSYTLGRTQFEREKERLIVEINQSLDIANRNFVQLNQNLESAVALGSNFGRVAQLWSEFAEIISPSVDEESVEDVEDVEMEEEEQAAEPEEHPET